MLHQPYIHNLSCVVAAPIQAWSEPTGQILGLGAQGIYCSDERIIRQAVISVNGDEPDWVSTQPLDGSAAAYLSFIRMDPAASDPLVSLQRTRSAAGGRLSETFELRSALAEATEFNIELRLVADNTALADIKVGKSSTEPVTTDIAGWKWRDDDTHLVLSFDGSPQVNAETPVVTAIWNVTVPAGGAASFGWAVTAHDADAPMVGSTAKPLKIPSVADPSMQQLLHRAVGDLNGLRMTDRLSPSDSFLAAGAPWFFTMFGRDSIIAARMLLPIDTTIAGGTLRALAQRQGESIDAESAEQPGKILHEVRRATTKVTADGSVCLPPDYFGTVDATPLWIILLRDAWRSGLPEKEVKALLPHLERALAWLHNHGDSDGDGFLEYLDTTGHGLANQGWKDSADSIRWHDGRLAQGPIALCEVQGYAYAAAIAGAELLEAFAPVEDQTASTPQHWRNYAKNMADSFRASFWCMDEDGPYPAIALDADKKPVDAVASNMGHLLGTGILNPAETATVVSRLMGPTLFSGYGIRTISSTNASYWPTRYHGGAVWTHDTALILSGMVADGYSAEARILADGLLAAARGFDWRLPELFSGQGADQVWPPVPYPASCHPQAWAAASAIPMAQALGLLPSP
ncbi:glycogen debranching N-terminal domain-containing protein [Arthrobacter sp. E3]|uniref:glycogen debranching N-terminal domain-containing protein n=1 Tax=Arthrobacter sp. E3 TaxID=517402 RepID=UPI001A9437F4|nr:glycogen debranching N-terminal domain-containing protein [Arthrobacter sp. E3]